MSKRTNIKLGLECELANHSTKSGNFYGLIFGCPNHLNQLDVAIEALIDLRIAQTEGKLE